MISIRSAFLRLRKQWDRHFRVYCTPCTLDSGGILEAPYLSFFAHVF